MKMRIKLPKLSFKFKKEKIKKIFSWPFWPLFIALSFLFLPGNSFYETLDLSSGAVAPDEKTENLPSLPNLQVKILSGEPQIAARSALLADYDSGQILYQKNIDQALPMASLTKIMTALIILEEIPQEEIITVSRVSAEGKTVGLSVGEQFLVSDLVYALLVMSGNDVAEILAQSYPGGRIAFIARMNEKARQLGLTKTSFVNPHGLDQVGHYSSARDLFALTNYALKNDLFREIIKKNNGLICDLTRNSCYQIEATNELISFPGVLGVKTGYTDQAGGCFVGFWEQEDRRFLSVILGSNNRFWETQNLLGWGMVSFLPEKVNLLDFLD
ncbi:MAG: Protein containing Peptidase S11, D-alanyl-D-alanine carboxypeptidase A domain [Microgenomates bacterium 39_6]|nr:MAG: Protein containing Peptidase S11, D-alanyl-D-alanine carboxypeptidase A domain [Microgenomates bacterium 39_6]